MASIIYNKNYMLFIVTLKFQLLKANSWIGRAQIELNSRTDAIQVAESERDEARNALEYEKRRMREMEDK
jgi:hypothetical protein